MYTDFQHYYEVEKKSTVFLNILHMLLTATIFLYIMKRVMYLLVTIAKFDLK